MSATVAADEPVLGRVPQTAGFRVNWAFTLLEAVLWVWSILVCVPFWLNDPNYAYGWVVPGLMFFFLWRRLGAQPREFWASAGDLGRQTWRLNPWLVALPGLLLFPLEVYRTEYQASGMVLWGINLAKVAFSMAGAWWLGGRPLVALTLFPLLFFLTGVPWPAKIAGPVQQNLMIGVANVISEILLWLAIPVKLEGAVLNLSKGTVGIVEACSGIRSLQSGLMISLAIGELFWLSRGRRAVLVLAGVVLALVSNLGRTFTLCWIMEQGGPEAMHARHDAVGNWAMYSFYALIFVVGKVLARGTEDIWPTREAGTWRERVARLSWGHVPDFRPLLLVTVGSFLLVHGWYQALEWRARPQKEPMFTAVTGAGGGNEREEFSEDVWSALGADVGDRVTRRVADAPAGMVSGYHLFWRPSARSRTALFHRPDICMPGSGWKQVGGVERTEVDFDGRRLEMLVFRFERPPQRAIQLWGVWRNGETVDFDYGDRLRALPERAGFLPTDRHMRGVELLSCVVGAARGEAPLEVARRELPKMFRYQPRAVPAGGGPAVPARESK